MAWFKVDDRFWSHPKTAELSDGATALWVRAGSWSASHLTDGYIPLSALRFFRARRRSADELVAAGLWSAARGGFVFHDWAVYQPSKEQVTAKREATRSRVDAWRERQRNSVTETSQFGDGNAAPDPTRTRTRPDPVKEASLPSEGKKRELRLPKDWAPNASHLERGREAGIDVLAEAESFRLHAETHDRHAANWNAAFTTWLKKARPSAPVVQIVSRLSEQEQKQRVWLSARGVAWEEFLERRDEPGWLDSLKKREVRHG